VVVGFFAAGKVVYVFGACDCYYATLLVPTGLDAGRVVFLDKLEPILELLFLLVVVE
jgi:hypothetical protein